MVHGRSSDGLRGMDEISTLGRTDVAGWTGDGRIGEPGACELGLKGGESALLSLGDVRRQ